MCKRASKTFLAAKIELRCICSGQRFDKWFTIGEMRRKSIKMAFVDFLTLQRYSEYFPCNVHAQQYVNRRGAVSCVPLKCPLE